MALALSTATPAPASPWVVSAQEISATSYAAGPDGPIIDTTATLERGFGGRPHAGPRTAVVFEGFAQSTPLSVGGRSAIALKTQLHRGPHWASAIQGGPVYGLDASGRCVGAGGEVRAGLGRAGRPRGAMPKGQAFAAVELAYRTQGGCADALREATIGYEIEHKWILLAQAFQDRDLHGTETLKVQVSAVRFRRTRGLQVGFRYRVDGSGGEPALIVGVWRRARRPGH